MPQKYRKVISVPQRESHTYVTDLLNQYYLAMKKALINTSSGSIEQKKLIEADIRIIELLEKIKFCNAITRKGTYCKRKPVIGKSRCRLHGGLSTGPKTEEGRKRVAQASQLRMKEYWREKKERV